MFAMDIIATQIIAHLGYEVIRFGTFRKEAGMDGSRTHRGLLRNPPTILKTARPTGTEPPPIVA